MTILVFTKALQLETEGIFLTTNNLSALWHAEIWYSVEIYGYMILGERLGS